jgi:DNA invertase Pin-like site-specific DNA recombinase
MKRAVLYLRVSKDDQHVANQLQPLQLFCKERNLEIIAIYQENGSAWTAGHQPQWKRLIADASHRHFDVLVCWSIDRLTREGIDAIFMRIKVLRSYNVTVLSYQEAWLETLGSMADLMLAILSWVANFESDRRSKRTRAGLAEKRLHGGGRRGPDKVKRKTRTIKRPVFIEREPTSVDANL